MHVFACAFVEPFLASSAKISRRAISFKPSSDNIKLTIDLFPNFIAVRTYYNYWHFIFAHKTLCALFIFKSIVYIEESAQNHKFYKELIFVLYYILIK